ncbi:MAG: BTAD domain-containing putative transcriptional regulator [Caldilineaceae bacterium]
MLTIRTLGQGSIELDGRPLHFESRTVAAMLIYLACQRKPMSRETLAELFWPERTQKQARSNLRVALHRLRQQAAEYLLITQTGAAVKPNAAITVDAAHFEAQIVAGHLAEAITLYHNDFLTDFYLDGSPIFEHWALLERERLRTLALAAYQQLIDHYATSGQLIAAITTAQQLLHLDPLHEPTHRQLMRLLAQAGQRSAALAQYERCRQLLRTELAVSPDDVTTALAEQIRTGELDKMTKRQDDRMKASGHPGILSSLHNLPPQPTPFIGRRAELEQILQRLANPDCRLLTLIGVGGIGKTRLAIAAAENIGELLSTGAHNDALPFLNPQFKDGICYVALAPVDAAEFVAVTLAQSLGLATNSSDLLAEIATYLRPRHLLLILDNFEHLLAAADILIYLLEQAPQLKVIVTSRQRLHLREEWLLPVGGLAFANDGLRGNDVDHHVAGEAGVLFLSSAQRVQPGFQMQGQEAAITTVCQLVEGLPLALELAASWVRVMPCVEIARRIQQDADFLTTPLRNLPERHRSMRALFDHSWHLLSPMEQSALMRLSVFRGGCQLEEATAVTDATLALLLGLVDKSLVCANGQQRFDLHELVRQYAAERLIASGEGELVRQYHYNAYLRFFRTGDSHLRGPHAATWAVHLEAELDNLRAALQWTFDSAHYMDATWLMLATCWFWEHRGLYEEAHHWFAQLLPYRHVLPADLRLAIMIWYNPFALKLHAPQLIEHFWDELLALQESTSLPALRSAFWFFYSTQATDAITAAHALEQSLAYARAAYEAPVIAPEYCFYTDRDFILGTGLWNYARHLIDLGDVKAAAATARESYDFFQSRNRSECYGGLFILGRLALLAGNTVGARRYLQDAAQLVTATQKLEALHEMQSHLGLVTLYCDDIAEARRLLDACLQLCLRLKSSLVAARVCAYLAEAALWQGKLDEAAQWLVQSLADGAQPKRGSFDEVQRCWVAARLATAQQDYPRAATLFGFAEQAHGQIHHVISGPMRALADEALATVEAALEPAIFAAAFAAGQQMTLEEAFADFPQQTSTHRTPETS